MQHVEGSSLGGNTLQSATSAPGQQAQYPQQLRWRNTTPGNQGATGQGTGGLSSTSTSGLGVGAGAYGASASAPGQQGQYPQQLRWRNTTPVNQQGATGQGTGSSSSTSTSGLGVGAGAHGVSA
jgi:hypothetical protein